MKEWLAIIAAGILGGLGIAWLEKALHWKPGTGRQILFGIMILAGIFGAWGFYRMIRAEVEEEP